IDSLKPVYFLTPALKNMELPMLYDSVTHYVAYELFPKRTYSATINTHDQFGEHDLQVQKSEFLLVPTKKLTVDPGTGSIHGCKWNDLDCDGIWDPNELPHAGVIINLSYFGVPVGSTVTDAYGCYSFTPLLPGMYTVSEVLPPGWEQCFPQFPPGTHNVNWDGEETIGPLNFGNKQIPHVCPSWTQTFHKKNEGMGFKIPTDARLMTRNLAIRDTGDIYICGYSDGYGTKYDYITNKYDEYGTLLLWTAIYNYSPVNGDDKAYALTIDKDGNVYVTGESYGGRGSKMDIATVKYNSAGVEQWVKRWSNPNYRGRDAGYAIVLNPDENMVYVTGETYNGTAKMIDYITIAYDAITGVIQWTSFYNNGQGYETDKAYAIAMDPTSGNPVVTGESYAGTQRANYATIMYNGATGAQIWLAQYNGIPTGRDYAFAIKTDGSRNVYVTGASEGYGTSFDYATLKYSSAGAQIWVKKYNHTANQNDFGYDLALDSDGNVYVTGSSKGATTNLDYATLKYDGLTGAPIWATENRYDGIKKNDIARSIVVCDSSVFVTGSSDQGKGRKLDYLTQKIDAVTGDDVWIGKYNRGLGHMNDIAYNVAVRPKDCCVVLTGTSDGWLPIAKRDFATIQGPSSDPVPGTITTPAVYDGESEDEDEMPTVFALRQNYPNPFNPITTIVFELPEEAFVSLSVYNILGQELLKVLDNELMDSGIQEAEFDASSLASGVYFYRFNAVGTGSDEEIPAQSFNKVMKMLLLK
ncbi:MAG: SBBP repeat-containing protein, partial [Bacteroidota bacterium]|nr:SBBP repeat-containing protein [Bacteroidota bacterium]